jgi:hypothetical protein
MPPIYHDLSLIWAVRVTVSLPINSPGMGINWSDWYVTETSLAVAPSGPVAEPTVTISGSEVHVVTPLKLCNEPSSPKAIEQAVLESVAVVPDVEVYIVATRAAFSVQIKA